MSWMAPALAVYLDRLGSIGVEVRRRRDRELRFHTHHDRSNLAGALDPGLSCTGPCLGGPTVDMDLGCIGRHGHPHTTPHGQTSQACSLPNMSAVLVTCPLACLG